MVVLRGLSLEERTFRVRQEYEKEEDLDYGKAQIPPQFIVENVENTNMNYWNITPNQRNEMSGIQDYIMTSKEQRLGTDIFEFTEQWNIIPDNIDVNDDPEFYEYLLEVTTTYGDEEEFFSTWNILPGFPGDEDEYEPYAYEYFFEIIERHYITEFELEEDEQEPRLPNQCSTIERGDSV